MGLKINPTLFFTLVWRIGDAEGRANKFLSILSLFSGGSERLQGWTTLGQFSSDFPGSGCWFSQASKSGFQSYEWKMGSMGVCEEQTTCTIQWMWAEEERELPSLTKNDVSWGGRQTIWGRYLNWQHDGWESSAITLTNFSASPSKIVTSGFVTRMMARCEKPLYRHHTFDCN